MRDRQRIYILWYYQTFLPSHLIPMFPDERGRDWWNIIDNRDRNSARVGSTLVIGDNQSTSQNHCPGGTDPHKGVTATTVVVSLLRRKHSGVATSEGPVGDLHRYYNVVGYTSFASILA